MKVGEERQYKKGMEEADSGKWMKVRFRREDTICQSGLLALTDCFNVEVLENTTSSEKLVSPSLLDPINQ